jgi:hypothetical protein
MPSSFSEFRFEGIRFVINAGNTILNCSLEMSMGENE